MPWCVGVIGHDGSDPGMKAGLCAFQRVVSLPAPSWGANNTLPIACSHIYMKFKTIQWFDHFGLPDEARESLSAYLKAAPLCSKACLAPAAIGKVQCLCDKAPVAPPWLHIPGSGLGGREAASRCSGLTAGAKSEISTNYLPAGFCLHRPGRGLGPATTNNSVFLLEILLFLSFKPSASPSHGESKPYRPILELRETEAQQDRSPWQHLVKAKWSQSQLNALSRTHVSSCLHNRPCTKQGLEFQALHRYLPKIGDYFL